jgi:hypothetical protein
MTSSFPARTFWLYLNIDVFPAAWAAYRGLLITSSNYGTETFRPLSYWPLSLLKDRQNTRLQKELRLEEIRRDFHPHQVSRLHGIYLWGDKTSAERGQERWGIAAGTHFHSDYLVELAFTYTAMSRVDTTWIDVYLLPDSISLDNSNEGWMHSYWKGEPYPNAEPLWEYIVEGRGVLWGTTLRTKAYEVVKRHAPLTLGQMELSRIAVELESDLYHIAPFMRRLALTGFRVDYFGDTHDQNDGFMEKLGQHIFQIAQVDRSQINWDAINLLKETTYRPGLHHMGFEFDSTEFAEDEENFARLIVSQYDGTVWAGLSDPPATVRVPRFLNEG